MGASLQHENCPRCGSLSDNFANIDAGMRIALQEGGLAEQLPQKVCSSCYEQLTSSVSQGLKLRMERDQREKNKMMMWKNRVHLIKNARNLMTQKAYSEAAVQYEKYLRVLEVVYNLKKNELSPAVFNNSARSKELTVVASVYWDLVRIYDASPRYGDRMQKAAEKLAEFLPYSTIYPDVIKKAEIFARTAKNPLILRTFLKATKSRRGPCFVSDAAFADYPRAAEPGILRAYRDQVLMPTPWGRKFVALYYRVSPPVARYLCKHPRTLRLTQAVLIKIAFHAKKSLKCPQRIDVLKRDEL